MTDSRTGVRNDSSGIRTHDNTENAGERNLAALSTTSDLLPGDQIDAFALSGDDPLRARYDKPGRAL